MASDSSAVNKLLDGFERDVLEHLKYVSFNARQNCIPVEGEKARHDQVSLNVTYGPLDFVNSAQRGAFEDKINWLLGKDYAHITHKEDKNIDLDTGFKLIVHDVIDEISDLTNICMGVDAMVDQVNKTYSKEKYAYEQELNLSLNVTGLPHK